MRHTAIALTLFLAATLALNARAQTPDRSAPMPEGWTWETFIDSEADCGWTAPDEEGFEDLWSVFQVAHTTEARAAGKSSCRWRLQAPQGGPSWAELTATRLPRSAFHATSIWLKNPRGHRLLCWIKLRDADGADYTVPGVPLGEQLNWYEIAFHLKDYVPVTGTADPQPGITFPLRRMALVVSDIQPEEPYVLYLDELRLHHAPPAVLEVIELVTPRQVSAGGAVPVRLRLRAKTQVPAPLPLSVGLELNGSVLCAVTAPQKLPESGAVPGSILDPIEVSVSVPSHAAGGTYRVSIVSPRATVNIPDPSRLPTSQVEVVQPDSEVTSATVTMVAGRPKMVLRGQPVRKVFSLTNAADAAELSAMRSAAPDLVRFRATVGAQKPGLPGAKWTAPGAMDFTAIDAAVRQILAAYPDAMVLPELWLIAPDWWIQTHPDAQVMVAEGADAFLRVPYPSYASQSWRDDGGAAITSVVEHLENGPFANHVAGYQLAAGPGGQWATWDSVDGRYGDYSAAGHQAFQMWLEEKYKSLERLRGAWGQPVRPATDRPDAVHAVTSWSGIDVPHVGARRDASSWLLDPVGRMPVVDYRLFCSQVIVDCIQGLADAAKSASGGRKLIGAPYGHFMQLSGEGDVERSGHLALTAALQSNSLDFLVAPRDRSESGAVLMPAASVMAAGKVLLPAIPDAPSRTLDGLASSMEQSGIIALDAGCVGAGDGFGSGPAEDDDRQVAVIVDDQSLAFLGARSPVSQSLLVEQMQQFRQMGAPVDVWLLEDFASRRVPRYRAYFFLNAFSVEGPFVQQVLRAQMTPENVVVWMCAPGLVGTSFSGRRMMNLTGIGASVVLASRPMQVKVSASAGQLVRGLSGDITYGVAANAGPSLDIFDPRIQVLGTQPGGRPGLVAKEGPAGTTVVSTAPGMPADLLRALARAAGVHIYSAAGDRLYAGQGFLAVTATGDGTRTILLPRPVSAYALPGPRGIGDGLSQLAVPVRRGATQFIGIGQPGT